MEKKMPVFQGPPMSESILLMVKSSERNSSVSIGKVMTPEIAYYLNAIYPWTDYNMDALLDEDEDYQDDYLMDE